MFHTLLGQNEQEVHYVNDELVDWVTRRPGCDPHWVRVEIRFTGGAVLEIPYMGEEDFNHFISTLTADRGNRPGRVPATAGFAARLREQSS
jgi:hypothetical protein